MKVFDIDRFFGGTLDEIITFLKEDFRNGIRDMLTALRALDFSNNFKSFVWNGDLIAGETATITNALKSVPSYRIVVRAAPLSAGTIILDDSTKDWTRDVVFIRNSGTATARVKIVFFE